MTEAEKLEKPIRKLLKAKCSLPRCISNAVLFSPTGYDVPKLLDKVDEQEITNMMVWLNSDELIGKVTRKFFKTIQEYLSTLHFPGEKPLDVTLQGTRNKYYYILSRLNTRCLNIRTNIPEYSLVHTMTVPNDALLHEILPESIWKQAKYGLKRKTWSKCPKLIEEWH
jgi:hypothetical protein